MSLVDGVGTVQTDKHPSNYKFIRPNDGWTGLRIKPDHTGHLPSDQISDFHSSLELY